MEIRTAEYGELALEIEIAAPVEEVWRALVERIGQWWPDEFYAGGQEGGRSFHLEAKPGGRMFEEWSDGGGLLWGTVVAVELERKLQIIGYAFPEWGGPGTWYGTWTLESENSKTILRFTEATVGKVTETGVESKRKGWTYLFGSVLKAFVEGSPIPAWSG